MYKVRYFTLLVVFSFNATLFAQTPDSSLGTYPLQVGNLWQYWTYDFLNGQATLIYGWTEKISDDTVMQNGKHYFVITSDHPLSNPTYLRQELNKVFQFNNEKDSLIFDFTKHKGDTILVQPVGIGDTLFQLISEEGLLDYFSQNRKVWTYYTFLSKITYYEKKELVDDIGVRYLEREGGDEWFLRGAIINGVQYGTITSVKDDRFSGQPTTFELFPNYPNPFNMSTIISFSLDKEQNITIAIYDLLGRKVASLINNKISSGLHKIVWSGKDDYGTVLSSGVYICRIHNQTSAKLMKLLMIK